MVAVSLGVTQRRSKGPVERTIAEYERPFPTLLIYICNRRRIRSGVGGGKRNCLQQRQSHTSSAKSNREIVVISLSDKGSVGGCGTCMRSREDRRRMADPCTIVHARGHKSMHFYVRMHRSILWWAMCW